MYNWGNCCLFIITIYTITENNYIADRIGSDRGVNPMSIYDIIPTADLSFNIGIKYLFINNTYI